MEDYHPQGYAQLLQTVIVMIFALLSVITYGYRAYSTRGWWARFLSMVVVFAVLVVADLSFNDGVGGDPGEYQQGIGTGLHFVLLIIVSLIAIGTFIATFRATIKKSKGKSGVPSTTAAATVADGRRRPLSARGR